MAVISGMKFSMSSKFQISCVSFLLLLSFATSKSKPCEIPAIFNFGASNSDTGGFSAALRALKPPFGETYFHRPSGRISDGRIILDFIAESYGLPYISAYLDSLGSNFSHGANFATLGSTILPPGQNAISPFHLHLQYSQFMNFIHETQYIRQQGGIFATLMPQQEYFSKALYTFDIGQNDLTTPIFGNITIDQVKASVPDIVKSFSNDVKNIYNLGARSFWIHNTGPLGCLSSFLTKFPSAEKDEYGCAKAYNEVAQYFNQHLKEALAQLRKDLPNAAITYVDIFSAKLSLFQHPKKYGFEQPHVACCGYGGEYNFSNSGAVCGATINVNGTNILVGSCKNPSHRILWDGIHYTEAANKVVFDKISNGAFSDPPVPLNRACHK